MSGHLLESKYCQMEPSGKAIIIYIYNSFNDPLFKNLMYEHLLTLVKEDSYRFYLITFEQKAYAIAKDDQEKIKRELADKGIIWFPLTFHTGRFLLLKKAYDFSSAFILVSYLKFFRKAGSIFSYANVAASHAVIFSKTLNLKFLTHTYEPHAEFMADLGHWQKSSLNYKVLHALEEYAGSSADVIFTGTRHMVKELEQKNVKAKVFRAPTSVDETKFFYSEEARNRIRKQLNLNGRKVLVYLGKFGGLYYDEEIITFFKTLYSSDKSFYFLVISKDPHEKINQWFIKYGLPPDSFAITSSNNYQETSHLLSAADIGLNAVPPTPAQKFRSPFKTAEYLLCGLPFITCEGISEDDEYASKHRVGVVVKDFSEKYVLESIPVINQLLEEDKQVLRNRCRHVGIEYRAKSNIDKLFSKVFAEI
jgi:hypothetical protein